MLLVLYVSNKKHNQTIYALANFKICTANDDEILELIQTN